MSLLESHLKDLMGAVEKEFAEQQAKYDAQKAEWAHVLSGLQKHCTLLESQVHKLQASQKQLQAERNAAVAKNRDNKKFMQEASNQLLRLMKLCEHVEAENIKLNSAQKPATKRNENCEEKKLVNKSVYTGDWETLLYDELASRVDNAQQIRQALDMSKKSANQKKATDNPANENATAGVQLRTRATNTEPETPRWNLTSQMTNRIPAGLLEDEFEYGDVDFTLEKTLRRNLDTLEMDLMQLCDAEHLGGLLYNNNNASSVYNKET